MATQMQPGIAMFLASSVHDMKNSLGLLGPMLERLVAELPDDADRADYSHMLYEVKRINASLMHLLTLYKLGAELYPFYPMPGLVAELFHDIVLQNQVLIETRGITLEVDVPEDLVWEFDADLINGVIGHAINNTIKYTQDKIKLTTREVDGQLELRVEDNGRGYPAGMLGDSRNGKLGVDFHSGSTGLGIYFAEHVAGMHSNGDRIGSIRLENGGAYGGGCFVLVLP